MAGHIDTTKKFFSAWARQDHAAVLELVHDDVVYQNMPFTDVMRGKEARKRAEMWLANKIGVLDASDSIE